MNILHYLGKEWVLGEYECWAMVAEVYERELGIPLPRANLGSAEPKEVRKAFAENDTSNLFELLPLPRPFSVVAMGRSWISHVGVYLETEDGPRILHNQRGSGVVCESPEAAAEAINIIGYYGLK